MQMILDRFLNRWDALAAAGMGVLPAWLREPDALTREVLRDLTALGSQTVLLLVVMWSALMLWRRSRVERDGASRHAGLPGGAKIALTQILAGYGLAQLATEILKRIIARPRPQLEGQLTQVFSASFPSSHAAVSSAVYLGLALAWRRAGDGKSGGRDVGAAIFLTLVIGASRVLLRVHYPTDVLAGWILGAAVAVSVDAAAQKFARARKTY